MNSVWNNSPGWIIRGGGRLYLGIMCRNGVIIRWRKLIEVIRYIRSLISTQTINVSRRYQRTKVQSNMLSWRMYLRSTNSRNRVCVRDYWNSHEHSFTVVSKSATMAPWRGIVESGHHTKTAYHTDRSHHHTTQPLVGVPSADGLITMYPWLGLSDSFHIIRRSVGFQFLIAFTCSM